MKKLQTLSVSALLFATAATTLLPQSVFAATCKGVETAIEFDCKTGSNPVISLLLSIVNLMAIGVGIAVVGGIVWGAITYIRSNGNSSIAQQGITIIINAVVGLLLFIFMYAAINFLVPGGLFT